MDFGIARLREEGDVPTSGPVAGTPQYMSPEQIRRAEVDGRSDLYSLGVLLYWLLAGHAPFSADNVADLVRKTLNEAPPALKPLDPATPDALLDMVCTLLAKDPADRYQSGSELIEALSRIDDILVAVLLVAFLTVLAGAYVLSRRLTAPLEMLRKALRQITHGRLDNRIRVHRNDEFEHVFDAYNAMADSLEARRFVAPSAKRLADDPRSNVDSRMSASINDTVLIDAEVIAAAEKERPAS